MAPRLSSFKYEDLDQSLPEFEGGAADADTMWERIDYFLERIVPVATEYKVQMACHPQDPGIKDNEYRGVARVMGTVEALKKFVAMHESPYHGLNFCQGTVSEMLETARRGDLRRHPDTSAAGRRYSTSTSATSRAASWIL